MSSVNSIFVGSSNEIGAFESGVTAKLFGTVPSVVLGGVATLVVVAVTAWRLPALRKLGRMEHDDRAVTRGLRRCVQSHAPSCAGDQRADAFRKARRQ